MGAAYVSHVFEKCRIDNLSKQVTEVCHQANYESGHIYSGDWGEKIVRGFGDTGKIFNTVIDTDEWLSDHTDKWGALLAVKVLSAPKTINTKSLDKKIHNLYKKLNNVLIELGEREAQSNYQVQPLMNSILERAKSSKSQLKGCKSCGSKVAIALLNRYVCPVCGHNEFLLTETDKKKFYRLRKQVEELSSLISELKTKQQSKYDEAISKNKDDWFWLVGGWCPE